MMSDMIFFAAFGVRIALFVKLNSVVVDYYTGTDAMHAATEDMFAGLEVSAG